MDEVRAAHTFQYSALPGMRAIERLVPHITVMMTYLKDLAKSNSELAEEVELLYDKPTSTDIADCCLSCMLRCADSAHS
ncbi:hypothetical protein J6590_032158 [Homalodisca vitripennis]|nr:hypothetical protein J6590_032158 [Homalodisca vitripennis]